MLSESKLLFTLHPGHLNSPLPLCYHPLLAPLIIHTLLYYGTVITSTTSDK